MRVKRLSILLLVLFLAACDSSDSVSASTNMRDKTLDDSHENTMSDTKTNKHPTSERINEMQENAKALIALDDQQYFAINQDFSTELSQKLAGVHLSTHVDLPPDVPEPTLLPAVLALSAPSAVDISKQMALPLLYATRTTGFRKWQVDWKQNARIVWTNLENGKTGSSTIVHTHKRTEEPKPSMSGPQPDELNASAVVNEVGHIEDARSLLGLAWAPSRYAMFMINFDWPSNVVTSELFDPALQKPLVLEQTTPSDYLMDLLASDAETANSDAAMPEGVDIQIPEKAEVYAEIRLNGIVNIMQSDAAIMLLDSMQDTDSNKTNARVLMASLLLVKRDDEIPIHIDLKLPAMLSSSEGSDRRIQSKFSFDVQQADLKTRVIQGKYSVYFVVGKHISGPHNIVVGSALVK